MAGKWKLDGKHVTEIGDQEFAKKLKNKALRMWAAVLLLSLIPTVIVVYIPSAKLY